MNQKHVFMKDLNDEDFEKQRTNKTDYCKNILKGTAFKKMNPLFITDLSKNIAFSFTKMHVLGLKSQPLLRNE